MIYDPLFELLRATKVGYLPLSIGYGFSFILAMIIMSYVSGRIKSVKEYLRDLLGAFVWPFFVLAPIVVFYLISGDLSTEINKRFAVLGLNYRDYSLKLDQSKLLFGIIVLLACGEGIANVFRYHKNRPALWLSKPKFLQPISTVLFNIPLGVMALAMFFRVLDQWITFHRFMNSGWRPLSVYNADEMYGLRWLYDIFIKQMTIAVLASFSSLLILIREGHQKHSWIYKVIFLLSILSTGIALYILSVDMNSLFKNIYTYFLDIRVSKLNQFTQLIINIPLDATLQKLTLLQEISVVKELPRSMPIPAWLNGIIGLRLIIFIPEIYSALAKPLGWRKFPLNIKKIVDLIK